MVKSMKTLNTQEESSIFFDKNEYVIDFSYLVEQSVGWFLTKRCSSFEVNIYEDRLTIKPFTPVKNHSNFSLVAKLEDLCKIDYFPKTINDLWKRKAEEILDYEWVKIGLGVDFTLFTLAIGKADDSLSYVGFLITDFLIDLIAVKAKNIKFNCSVDIMQVLLDRVFSKEEVLKFVETKTELGINSTMENLLGGRSLQTSN